MLNIGYKDFFPLQENQKGNNAEHNKVKYYKMFTYIMQELLKKICTSNFGKLYLHNFVIRNQMIVNSYRNWHLQYPLENYVVVVGFYFCKLEKQNAD